MILTEFTNKTLDQLRIEQKNIANRHVGELNTTELPDWYAAKLATAEKIEAEINIEKMCESAAQTGAKRIVPAQKMEYGDARLVFWECMKSESALFNRLPDVDDENKEHIRQIVKWAICDTSGELDPLKGLAFLGNVGSGKTYLMRVLARFYSAAKMPGLEIASAIDVFDAVAIDKDALLGYCAGQKCFDDFGQEPAMLKSYGNEIEVMGSIVTRRHVKFERAGLFTHLTSNLTFEEVESRYGSRIVSRIAQMCNVIIFGGKPRRK